jgi:hypothetical protein
MISFDLELQKTSLAWHELGFMNVKSVSAWGSVLATLVAVGLGLALVKIVTDLYDEHHKRIKADDRLATRIWVIETMVQLDTNSIVDFVYWNGMLAALAYFLIPLSSLAVAFIPEPVTVHLIAVTLIVDFAEVSLALLVTGVMLTLTTLVSVIVLRHASGFNG